MTEGNASIGFVRRLGLPKANEALIMSKRITNEELVATGFVNKVFDVGNPTAADYNDKFLAKVLEEVSERFDHLNSDSLVQIKALIQKPDRAALDRQGVEEALTGLKRFVQGIPQEEFRKLASGEKKHKL